MKNQKKYFLFLVSCFLFLVSCFLLLASSAQAGGPISVAPDGTSSAWGSTIALHPETGTCGSFTNAQMVTKIETNLALWENISGVDLNFNITTGTITADVTDANYTSFFVDSNDDAGLNDSINPVVFDDDGGIVADLFGSSARFSVLGFAGPDGFTDDFHTIADGQAFFNCRCLADNLNCGSVVFSEDDLDFTMVHEVGHMIGLDHTQVNEDEADASDTCSTTVAGDCTGVPTMYPQSVDADEQITPTRDDEVALQALYGATSLANNFATVVGTLVDSSGKALRCADVQAIPSSTDDTIAIVSGINASNEDLDDDGFTDGDGECLSGCGDFTLRGLDPDQNYNLFVVPISSRWTGGSSISPCSTGQISGIQEELIQALSAADLSAGGTVALGTITTISTGGIDEGGSGSDGDESGSSGSDGGSGGCSLTEAKASSGFVVLFFMVGIVFVFNLKLKTR